MKYSLGISNFLEEISSLSHSVVFLYFFALRNAGLEETQAGIKIARTNINSLRYADDTTLMVESEEELKSSLMKVKEDREKVGLKLNIQKTKMMASGPTTSWEIDGETLALPFLLIHRLTGCLSHAGSAPSCPP